MKTSQNKREKLRHLADHLNQRRTRLIRRWQGHAEQDSKLKILNTVSRKEFLDHIPEFLNSLETRLKEGPTHYSDASCNGSSVHGVKRWQQGFSIGEVVRDWNHLRQAILEEISQAIEDDPNLLEGAFSEAATIIAATIASGVNESVRQYEEIRQAEAQAYEDELKLTIDELNSVLQQQQRRTRECIHDLGGNIGLLSSIASLYRQESQPSPEERLGGLHASLEDGLAFTMELLEELRFHSEIEAHTPRYQPKDVELAEILNNALAPFRSLASQDQLSLETKGPAQLTVRSDERMLRRIVQNLLHNAFSHADEGRISISWEKDPCGKNASILIRNPGSLERLKQEKPLAQKLSARSDEASEGTAITAVAKSLNTRRHQGIGLSIAKRLCTVIGARLTLEEEKAGEVLAKVSLPLAIRDGSAL